MKRSNPIPSLEFSNPIPPLEFNNVLSYIFDYSGNIVPGVVRVARKSRNLPVFGVRP
jgi:hypothetical protein